MNFTRNANNISGTSLRGHVTAYYSQLIAAFGEPIAEADGYKVSSEWDIEFEDGKVASIYDYKETNLYDRELPSVAEFRRIADERGHHWHIGGKDSVVVDRILAILAATPVRPRVKTQAEQLREVGIAHAKAILEMVAALDVDYDRLAELRELRPYWSVDTNPATGPSELAELEAAAGECTSRDEAEERIREDALCVEMRGDWYAYGTEPADAATPAEFRILLATGGPACRLVGELDGGRPEAVKLQTQEWGTPWTDYDDTEEEAQAFLAFAETFYFGE